MREIGILTVAVLLASAVAVCGSIPLPAMSEEQAYSTADLVSDVTVLSVTPLTENGTTNRTARVVRVRILTQGVCTKEVITIRWDQKTADATWRGIAPPIVGQSYRTFLSDWRRSPAVEFEGVHPDWAFRGPLTNAPATKGFVDHVVRSGDTLYSLAGKYYGRPWKWNVIRIANFGDRSEGEVYPLGIGKTIRIPVFLIPKTPSQKDRKPDTADHGDKTAP